MYLFFTHIYCGSQKVPLYAGKCNIGTFTVYEPEIVPLRNSSLNYLLFQTLRNKRWSAPNNLGSSIIAQGWWKLKKIEPCSILLYPVSFGKKRRNKRKILMLSISKPCNLSNSNCHIEVLKCFFFRSDINMVSWTMCDREI